MSRGFCVNFTLWTRKNLPENPGDCRQQIIGSNPMPAPRQLESTRWGDFCLAKFRSYLKDVIGYALMSFACRRKKRGKFHSSSLRCCTSCRTRNWDFQIRSEQYCKRRIYCRERSGPLYLHGSVAAQLEYSPLLEERGWHSMRSNRMALKASSRRMFAIPPTFELRQLGSYGNNRIWNAMSNPFFEHPQFAYQRRVRPLELEDDGPPTQQKIFKQRKAKFITLIRSRRNAKTWKRLFL